MSTWLDDLHNELEAFAKANPLTTATVDRIKYEVERYKLLSGLKNITLWHNPADLMPAIKIDYLQIKSHPAVTQGLFILSDADYLDKWMNENKFIGLLEFKDHPL